MVAAVSSPSDDDAGIQRSEATCHKGGSKGDDKQCRLVQVAANAVERVADLVSQPDRRAVPCTPDPFLQTVLTASAHHSCSYLYPHRLEEPQWKKMMMNFWKALPGTATAPPCRGGWCQYAFEFQVWRRACAMVEEYPSCLVTMIDVPPADMPICRWCCPEYVPRWQSSKGLQHRQSFSQLFLVSFVDQRPVAAARLAYATEYASHVPNADA